jgi:hypothetical protein
MSFFCSIANAVESVSSEKIQLSEDNLILTEIYVDKLGTREIIEVYQYDGGYMVPLGMLSDILEFSINVDSENQNARGWFIAENRIFALDVPAGEVVVEGKKKKLDSRVITEGFNDLYVDSSYYSEWFPVDLEVNFSNLVLYVKPREKLPFQQRKEREKLRNRSLRRMGAEKESYQVVKEPYKYISYPFVDFDVGYDYSNQTNPSSSSTYSVLSQGDLLYHTAQLSMAGDSQESITGLRFNMSRSDEEGGLLGKAKAKSYSFGDITSVPVSLVTSRDRGMGFTISNTDLDIADEFDSTNFVGDSQPGWEVEIYRNGALIDFQVVGDDGRYEFTDIPIFFGNNIFRIVSYGPQGQVREKIETYLIDNSILDMGEFNYQLSVDRKSETIFGIDEENRNIEHESGERFVADFDYGITENMTGSVGFIRTPLEDGKFHEYQSIGFKNSFNKIFAAGMLTDVNFVYDSTGQGWATEILSNAKVKDVNVRARQAFFNDFVSEVENPNSQRRKMISKLDLDGRISKIIPAGISYRLSGEYETFENDREITSISNRLTTSIYGITLNNSLEFSSIADSGTTTDTADGSFSVRARYKRASFRLTADYDLSPQSQLRSINITGQKQITRETNSRFTLRKDFIGQEVMSLTASWNKRFDYFTLSAISTIDDQDNITAGTRLSFSLGHEPRENRWFFQDRGIANEGALSLRAFLDNNHNSIFDDGDEILSDVGYINGSGKFRGENTNPVIIPNIDPHKPSPVKIDYTTLIDPFWMPKVKGYNVVTRPGVVTELDFPVYITTEIDGMVYLEKGDLQKGLSRVILQLVNNKGEVVKETTSEFDGFYIFSGVIPGQYTIRISEESLKGYESESVYKELINIVSDSDVISGIDFVIKN